MKHVFEIFVSNDKVLITTSSKKADNAFARHLAESPDKPVLMYMDGFIRKRVIMPRIKFHGMIGG